MKRSLVFLAVMSVLAGCQPKAQVLCTKDAMQCPAGTAKAGQWVGRSGPTCEFRCD